MNGLQGGTPARWRHGVHHAQDGQDALAFRHQAGDRSRMA
jgi:hypothetical protein